MVIATEVRIGAEPRGGLTTKISEAAAAVSINYFGSVRLAPHFDKTFAEDSYDIFSFRSLYN